MMTFNRSVFSKVLMLVLGLMVLPLGLTGQVQAKPFPVRAFQMVFRPQIKSHTMQAYKTRIDLAAKLGYNAMVLHASGTRTSGFQVIEPGKIKFTRYTNDQVAELLAYARRAGIEPIVEVKTIGKQVPLIAKALLKKYPGMLQGNARAFAAVLNPTYKFPDGRDPYDVIALPLLDSIIALYGDHPPKYLLLGMDEIPLGTLQKCAQAMNTTLPRLFAKLLNRYTHHLIKQGITPLIYSDMLLSPKLAKPGHGIKGFQHDPRFNASHTTYAQESPSRPGVLTAMNDLTNRNKIIVVDWHYMPVPNKAYPSVDYFQKLGFKDVWGATWFDEQNIREFSRYAAKRGCGGMLSTFWHVSFSRPVAHWDPIILYNSAKFFNDPFFKPRKVILSINISKVPDQEASTPATDTHNGFFVMRGNAIALKIVVSLTPGIVPKNPVLLLRNEANPRANPLRVKLSFDAATHQLTGSVKLPKATNSNVQIYGSMVRFVSQQSQYLVHRYWPAHFYLTSKAPVQTGSIPSVNTLFAVDFSHLKASAYTGGLIQTTGKFQQPLVLMPPYQAKYQSEQSLDARSANGIFASVRPSLWNHMVTKGMRMKVIFRMDGKITRKKHCAIVSLGNYFNGMRLLIAQDRTVLLQFANIKGGLPIWISQKTPVPLGQWVSVQIALSPPDPTNHNRATVTLTVHQKTVRVKLPQPLLTHNPSAVLGLGVEYKVHESWKKSWPNFPGQIKNLTITDF